MDIIYDVKALQPATLALEISLAMTLVPLGTKIWVANDLNDVFRAVGTD
jgi:hypothetical protein